MLVDSDEHPRPDTTAESLGSLRPAFREGGTVTAGNASGINDGAAAMVVLSEDRAAELGVQPMGRILGYAWTGIAPEIMGFAPVDAIRKALDRAGIGIERVELFELNEAFAAQAVAVQRELGIGREVLNVNGGAIAMGHPLGATGGMILGTMLDELERSGKSTALTTLCIGAGMGTATIIERVN